MGDEDWSEKDWSEENWDVIRKDEFDGFIGYGEG